MANEEISVKLSALEDWLTKIQAPILNMLNPGVDFNRGDFDDFRANNLVMPEEFFTLYKWKNGTDLTGTTALGQTWLFRMASFMNFNRAFDFYTATAGQDEYWPTTRFPIFESGGGEVHTLECDPQSPQYGMVYFYSPGEIDFEVTASMFDSLYHLIDTVLSCYFDGIYGYSSINGNFITNEHKKLFAISRQKNPKSDYWKLKQI